MRRWLTALVWILVVALGTGAFEYYKTFRHPKKMEEWVTEYEDAWKAAVDKVADNPPVVADDFLKKNLVPYMQHKPLREKFFNDLDKKYQAQYDSKTTQLFDATEVTFRGQWEDAIIKGEDSPSVDALVQKVHEFHRAKLTDRLKRVDGAMANKHPRINLAIDSFSGYSVFRSQEFLDKLAKQNIKLHLVDDGAKYKDRIKTLLSGETPLAVFTVDALINNSADSKEEEPPGKIVLVIDESVGADAVIGFDGAAGDLDALQRSDAKIHFTEDSPSETLARLVTKEQKLSSDHRVAKDDVEAVYTQAKAAATEPHAFVLWEPYVTRLLKERPKARVLMDSANAKARGYIVDVLVVQKKFLEEHRKDRVEPIVRAYLEALGIHRQKGLSDLVLADSKKLVAAKKLKEPLTGEEAMEVAKKIRWRTFGENCAHFGISVPGTAPEVEPMPKMIEKINRLLVDTLAIGKTWDRQEVFFDATVCKNLLDTKFPTDEPPAFQPVAGQKIDPLTFRRGSDAISEESEEVLKGVAALMKKTPAYALEIRGHMLGDTDADRELAQKRADSVSRWLRDTGGVAADKLKTVVRPKFAENERAGVTIVVMQSGS